MVIANESDTSIANYNNEYETEETFADDAVVIFTYSASERRRSSPWPWPSPLPVP